MESVNTFISNLESNGVAKIRKGRGGMSFAKLRVMEAKPHLMLKLICSKLRFLACQLNPLDPRNEILREILFSVKSA